SPCCLMTQTLSFFFSKVNPACFMSLSMRAASALSSAQASDGRQSDKATATTERVMRCSMDMVYPPSFAPTSGYSRIRSVEHSEAQGVGDAADVIQQGFRIVGVDVGDHIAQPLLGLQVLAGDVGAVRRQRLVDACQDAGHVLVQVYQAMRLGLGRQADGGEVDAVLGTAGIDVVHDAMADEAADVLLRLQGAAAHMRGENGLWHLAQRMLEAVAVATRLIREHVYC